MTAHFQQLCTSDNVVDSAKQITNEQKCLNRWLKSNQNSINADKTKYILFSYNKHVNFQIIKKITNKSMNLCYSVNL